jgi:hypothetical protein
MLCHHEQILLYLHFSHFDDFLRRVGLAKCIAHAVKIDPYLFMESPYELLL